MPKAIWRNTIVAEAPTDAIVVVDGYTYFPEATVKMEHLQASDHHSVCSWKGTASYFHVVVGNEVNRNAAWYYSEPKDAARQVAGRIAFWRGVKVEQ